MKARYCILTAMALTLGACTAHRDEPTPASIPCPDGKTPLAVRDVTDAAQSRADIVALDVNKYDVYGCAAFIGDRTKYYYTYDRNDAKHFRKMDYGSIFDEEDNNREYTMFYFSGYYFPWFGDMWVLCCGAEKNEDGTEKPLAPTVLPKTLPRVNPKVEYMILDQTAYDGSYDVIAADRIHIVCDPSLNYRLLPFGHFHHIYARLDFNLAWDSSVPLDAAIIPKLRIDSIRVENTPCKGMLYVGEYVDYFAHPEGSEGVIHPTHWEELGPDAVVKYGNGTEGVSLPNNAGSDRGTLRFGGTYVVPQASRQRIVISYSIINADKVDGQMVSVKKSMNYVVFESDRATKNWLPGHKYTYNIAIGEAGKAEIQAVRVKRFVEGATGDTEIL